HGPRFSRRADGPHYCHRYIWLRRFGWSLTLVGHAVSSASVEPPVVAPRAAGAISQQFDRTQQDPRRKALHKSGAGVFTFAARKANDAPRGGRRQAIIAKLPPTFASQCATSTPGCSLEFTHTLNKPCPRCGGELAFKDTCES